VAVRFGANPTTGVVWIGFCVLPRSHFCLPGAKVSTRSQEIWRPCIDSQVNDFWIIRQGSYR